MSETLLGILLDSSIRILIAALTAGILLRCCSRYSSELRHTIWTMVLCAMLLMPVLTFVLPALPVTIRVPQKADTGMVIFSSTQTVPLYSGGVVAGAQTSSALAIGQSRSNQTPPRVPSPWASMSWSSIFGVVYVTGLIFFIGRLCLGWLGMQRIVKSSVRVEIPAGPIYQSDWMTTPVTTGLFSPRIILPAAWREWPKDDLQAILVHETEHIRRRDLLTSLLSNINCCLFWFHQLAWWLNKRIGICAEEACDNAALREIDSPQHYAEILVGMARAVHDRGARLSWMAAGMKGTGSLAKRIDRIISGKIRGRVSFARKVSIIMICGAVIFVIAACRQQALPTLAEEQQALARVQARLQQRRVIDDSFFAKRRRTGPSDAKAQKLSPPQAEALEEQLAKQPDDFEIRLELLQFYFNWAPKAGVDIPTIIRHRRDHVLWFIRSYPSDELASSPFLFINTDGADKLADPAGYAQGKESWLAQVDKNRSNAAVLANAAYFMQAADKQWAEKLLLQGKQLQPEGPWSMRLARQYSFMILGADAVLPVFSEPQAGLVLSVNPAELHGPSAQEARRRMDETKDFELLLNVGRTLVRTRNLSLDFDPASLGVQYLERAKALSPSPDRAEEVRIELKRVYDNNRQARLRGLPKEGRYEAAMALSDRDRFELFWDLALYSYGYGNTFDLKHRTDALREWDKAAKYATELARVAGKFRRDPEYGNNLFNANVMLAYVASRNGDVRGTLEYLHHALEAPTALNAGDWPSPWVAVCPYLTEQGHRDDVIAFLERLSQIDPLKRDELLAMAAQVRNGVKADWRNLP